jgi:hypothetical protein
LIGAESELFHYVDSQSAWQVTAKHKSGSVEAVRCGETWWQLWRAGSVGGNDGIDPGGEPAGAQACQMQMDFRRHITNCGRMAVIGGGKHCPWRGGRQA